MSSPQLPRECVPLQLPSWDEIDSAEMNCSGSECESESDQSSSRFIGPSLPQGLTFISEKIYKKFLSWSPVGDMGLLQLQLTEIWAFCAISWLFLALHFSLSRIYSYNYDFTAFTGVRISCSYFIVMEVFFPLDL